jgi:hypothetical protein
MVWGFKEGEFIWYDGSVVIVDLNSMIALEYFRRKK